MIAKSRQLATHDFLLILSAAVVLAFSAWPKPDAHQTVQIRQINGSSKTYSLAPSDPRLAKLKHELSEWKKPERSTTLAIAKWQADIAAFYAERTLPRSQPIDNSIIMPVSFQDVATKREAELAAREARERQHNFWLEFATKAEEQIDEEEKLQAQRRSLRASPPIVIGEVIPRPHAASTFFFSGLVGVLIALIFAAWTFAAPSIQVTPDAESRSPELRSKLDTTPCELRLSIPSQWIQVHQPWSVQLRLSAYAILILSALACVVF